MENITQYYAVLNIDSTASLETVKQAYRQLAKTWHPDKYVGNSKLTSQAEVEIKKINQAYSWKNLLTGLKLKQKLSPNKPQTSFVSCKNV